MEQRIDTPQVDTTEIQEEKHSLVVTAAEMTITSPADDAHACDFLRKIKTIRKRLEEMFEPTIAAANKAHKTAIASRKKEESPLISAEYEVKIKLGTYRANQECIRRNEEARLRAKLLKEEEEKRLAEAEALEAAGKTEAAEAHISRPIEAPPVVIPTTVPKVEGVSTRKIWKFRILNEADIPRAWMIPDEKRLGQHARNMREKAKVEGIEFYSEESVAVTGY